MRLPFWFFQINNIAISGPVNRLISYPNRFQLKSIQIPNQSKLIIFFLNENFGGAETMCKINITNTFKPVLRTMIFNNFQLIASFSVLLFYFRIPIFVLGGILLRSLVHMFNETQISISTTNFIEIASLRASQFLFPIWLKSLNLCSLILFSITIQGLQLVANLLKFNFVCALIPVSFHAFNLTSVAISSLIHFFIWSYSIATQFALLMFLISWYNFSLSKQVQQLLLIS